MDRVYIAGCGGMLGRAFYEEFAGRAELRCTDIDVNEDWDTPNPLGAYGRAKWAGEEFVQQVVQTQLATYSAESHLDRLLELLTSNAAHPRQ
jgi:RmlD substrate binding domain